MLCERRRTIVDAVADHADTAAGGRDISGDEDALAPRQGDNSIGGDIRLSCKSDWATHSGGPSPSSYSARSSECTV